MELFLVTHFLNWNHNHVGVRFMPSRPKMFTSWLDRVCLARLGGTSHLGEGAALPVPTLTHIFWEHFVALPGVLLAHEEVHTLILAGDGRGDLDATVSLVTGYS